MQWDTITDRFRPALETAQLSPGLVLAVLVAAGVSLWWEPAWRVLRIVVTLVHELGHAGVGMLFGQKFRGFVLNPDMSGHAVLAVERRPGLGVGRWIGSMASFWAGYPMPGIVAVAFVWCVARGWSAIAVSVVLVVLIASLPMVRSFFTAVATALTTSAVGALWWWRDDEVQAAVLTALAIFLLVGAWRHVVAVARSTDRNSDPGMLASLSHIPAVVWTATFVLALGCASWYVSSHMWQLIQE